MPQKRKKKDRKRSFFRKLRDKYRLVIMNDETFEEKLSFRLSRLNVFIVTGTIGIILIVGTIFLIAFTPLKVYIPGFNGIESQRDLYDLMLKADSLERNAKQKDLYINNIKAIIEGKEIEEPMDEPPQDEISKNYDDIRLEKSKEDSLLRLEIENIDKYYVQPEISVQEQGIPQYSINSSILFAPLKGYITNNFNPAKKHYGIDIVTKKNEPVKAVLDGTVIFSNWTLATGWVITLQHPGNILSVYKHNAVLLKKEGDFVKAGEAIAVVGESGEQSSGPHLHFELWVNGNSVNPRDYISF